MASVIFLRAVNVGGANRCQPALIAGNSPGSTSSTSAPSVHSLPEKTCAESALRAAIAKKLPFKCDIMICPGKQITDLGRKDPFARQPSGPDITHFVSVAAKPLRLPFPLPLSLPSDDDWLLKVIAIQGRFVLGLYRRQMKAIGYLGKIENAWACRSLPVVGARSRRSQG